MDELLTVTDMAYKWQEPPARINYLIRKNRIKESRVIGSTRLFNLQAQVRIKQSLYNIRIQR